MLEATLNFKLLEMCSRCGACYNICPSCMHIPGYDPRAVVRDILDGDYEKWLSSKHIWQCLECHFCLEMCYQHYGFENAMTALRTVAARKKLNLPEPKASGADEFRKLMELLKESRHKGGKPSGAKED